MDQSWIIVETYKQKPPNMYSPKPACWAGYGARRQTVAADQDL